MIAQNANLIGVDVFTKGQRSLPLVDRILQAMRAIWPRKTAENVACVVGVTPRAVKFWLAKDTGMSLESVAALLDTDEGFSILEAIMGDSDVHWWRVAKLAHQQDAAARQVRAMERQLAKAKALVLQSMEIE